MDFSNIFKDERVDLQADEGNLLLHKEGSSGVDIINKLTRKKSFLHQKS